MCIRDSYHTVLDCLSARGGAVQVPRSVEQVVLPRQDFFQSLDAKSFRERREQADSQPRSAARPAWDSERRSTARVADSAPPASGYGRFRDAGGALGRPPASVAGPTEAETSPAGKSEKPFVPAIPRQSRELPEQQTMEPLREEAPWRIAGEVLRTYIAVSYTHLDVYKRQAIGGLLSYLYETQKTDLSHINDLDYYEQGVFLELDLTARRNLELTETLRNKEKKGSLLWVQMCIRDSPCGG